MASLASLDPSGLCLNGYQRDRGIKRKRINTCNTYISFKHPINISPLSSAKSLTELTLTIDLKAFVACIDGNMISKVHMAVRSRILPQFINVQCLDIERIRKTVRSKRESYPTTIGSILVTDQPTRPLF